MPGAGRDARALKRPHCRWRSDNITSAWWEMAWGKRTHRAVGVVTAGFLMLAGPATAAGSPAELISSFRAKHGEVRVTRDATLDRIAMEQARAMAAKNQLSHEVLGPFTRRVASAGAGRAA